MGSSPWFLVFLRQKERGQLAILRGDDVELHSSFAVIDGHQAEAVAQTALVFPSVVFAEVTPVAVMMAGKGGLQFVVGHGSDCAGRGDDPAEWEFSRSWRWCARGFVGDVMDHVVMCGGAALAGGRMACRDNQCGSFRTPPPALLRWRDVN